MASTPDPPVCRVGVISDTHGWLRREALDALRGVDLIIHVGDIGDPSVLEELEHIAPVHAVRGNADHGAWAANLPESLSVEVGGVRLLVVHDGHSLCVDPGCEHLGAVICGHSHCATIENRQGVLYFNPGAAGPSRCARPVSVGLLTVHDHQVEGEILPLC